MNNLDLLRPVAVFAEVVEQGSFRGAAERLGLSPSYVSQLVSELEARLGRQLLFRSTRKIALTDAGEDFLVHARHMTEAFGAAMGERMGLFGRLRISAPSVAAGPLFARVVAKFAEDHRELTLEVMLDDAVVDPVADRVDLAIRIGDPGDDPRLARKLFETRGVVCCTPQSAEHIQGADDLQNLLWLRTPSMPDAISLQSELGDMSSVAPVRQVVLNNAALTHSMLRETAAFALFPEFAVRDALARGTLCNPLPALATPAAPVYALFTERRTELTNARAFVDALSRAL